MALSADPLFARAQGDRIENAAEEARAYFETIIDERRRRPREDTGQRTVGCRRGRRPAAPRGTARGHAAAPGGGQRAGAQPARERHAGASQAPPPETASQKNPRLPDAAIDELLRYASPVQRPGRCAREDVEPGGKRIGAGDVAISVIRAANREPGCSSIPARCTSGVGKPFVLRARHSLLHCCRGASLTVLEVRVAGTALPDRFASIRLPAQPRHREAVVGRGVEHRWIEVQRTATP